MLDCDGFYISGELATIISSVVDGERTKLRRKLEKDTSGYVTDFDLGKAAEKELPQWMNEFYRERNRNNWGSGEDTSAGRFPKRELEIFAELRRAILSGQKEKLVKAVRDLVNWSPGRTPEIPLLKEELQTIREGYPGEPEVPLATELYAYALFGKEDARTFLALIGNIVQSLGYQNIRELREQGSA